jgi:hypothetical protein
VVGTLANLSLVKHLLSHSEKSRIRQLPFPTEKRKVGGAERMFFMEARSKTNWKIEGPGGAILAQSELNLQAA